MATRQNLKTTFDALFADNTSGDISASDLRQLHDTILDTFVQNEVFTTAGTAPTYTLDLTPDLGDTTNSALLVKFHSAGSGSVTINIDGAGAVNIFAGGSQLDATAINTSLVYLLIKNGSNYDIIGSASSDPQVQSVGSISGNTNLTINSSTDVVEITLSDNWTPNSISGFKVGKQVIFKVNTTGASSGFPYQITFPSNVSLNDGVSVLLKNNTPGTFDLIKVVGINGSNNAQVDTVIYG